MKLIEILPLENTALDVPGGSKKRVLENLSHFLADRTTEIDSDELYQGLLARERLGSTGIGEGVAIPHCRMAGCSKITGAFLKLEDPVDFDAIDNVPVDLVFALIVPEEQNDEHLQVLSAIAELLQKEEARTELRRSSSAEQLYRTITSAKD
jgi:PTS system nitrogen regulatory IIA component